MSTPHEPLCTPAPLEVEPIAIRFAMCRFVDWRQFDRLIRDCFPEFSAAAVSYHVRDDARYSCIAWHDERPIGYWMHSTGMGPSMGWVEQIGVARPFRRRGLGKRLLLNYLQFASWVGFDQVGGSILKTNATSLATFRSLGFDTRPDSTDDRLHVLRTIKPLEFGTWLAMPTVAGIADDPLGARESFRHPAMRSIPQKVLGRIATTLIGLGR